MGEQFQFKWYIKLEFTLLFSWKIYSPYSYLGKTLTHICVCVCISTLFYIHVGVLKWNCWITWQFCFNFWGTAILFPQQLHHFVFPAATHRGPVSPHPIWHLFSFFGEKEMATHSSILDWESHGWRSLAGYSPWSQKESDTTGQLHSHFSHFHTYGYEVIPHCDFDCISLMISDSEHLFMCSLTTCISSLKTSKVYSSP